MVVAVVLIGVYAAITSTQGTSESGQAGSFSSLTGSNGLGKVKETDTSLANAEILRILGSIENINLNDDIFANPVFQSLEDSRFVIPKPVRIGRPNPFLPIGFDAVLASQTSEEDPFLDGGENSFFDDDSTATTTTTFFDEDGNPVPET